MAGDLRGRRIESHVGDATRPTTDKVREAVFNALGSLDLVDGARVLDLFAGSGALGLEALSRGAASVLLVEKRAPAAQVIRRNVERVGLPGARVVVSSLASLARRAADGPPAGLVLLDPPYDVASTTIADELTALVASGWVASDAIVVVERPASAPQSPMPWPGERREYGDTALWYGRAAVDREERDDA